MSVGCDTRVFILLFGKKNDGRIVFYLLHQSDGVVDLNHP